jgi:hypothetical protein
MLVNVKVVVHKVTAGPYLYKPFIKKELSSDPTAALHTASPIPKQFLFPYAIQRHVHTDSPIKEALLCYC